jgi:putative ABC transport system ATP-binding protein
MSSTTNGNALVQIQDVHKYFTRGNERINVLQGVNLDIPKGDFLALMGPSGSGKTTLLNLMGGLDAPSTGVVDVGGVEVSGLKGSGLSRWRSENIGFVFQLYNLLPKLTALQKRGTSAAPDTAFEVGASRARFDCPESCGSRRANESLSPSAFRRPGTTCRHRPGHCDGPRTAALRRTHGDLDRKAGDEILDLLQALNRDHGKTIVMVTHDPHAADRARRTLHLDKGVLS